MSDAHLPPGLRYPTQEELDQLAREPNPYCTAGPYVGGWLQIGYRILLLTEDEARDLAGVPAHARSQNVE